MSVPVLTEKSLRQSRQRYGCGLRVGRSCTFSDPHFGQHAPAGQRFLTNHSSAVASSGNMRVMSTSESPLRSWRPGALRAIFMYSVYPKVGPCVKRVLGKHVYKLQIFPVAVRSPAPLYWTEPTVSRIWEFLLMLSAPFRAFRLTDTGDRESMTDTTQDQAAPTPEQVAEVACQNADATEQVAGTADPAPEVAEATPEAVLRRSRQAVDDAMASLALADVEEDAGNQRVAELEADLDRARGQATQAADAKERLRDLPRPVRSRAECIGEPLSSRRPVRWRNPRAADRLLGMAYVIDQVDVLGYLAFPTPACATPPLALSSSASQKRPPIICARRFPKGRANRSPSHSGNPATTSSSGAKPPSGPAWPREHRSMPWAPRIVKQFMMLRGSMLLRSSPAHSRSKCDTQITSKRTKRTIPVPARLPLCPNFPGRLSWRASALTTVRPRIPPGRVQTDVALVRHLTNLSAVFAFLEVLQR